MVWQRSYRRPVAINSQNTSAGSLDFLGLNGQLLLLIMGGGVILRITRVVGQPVILIESLPESRGDK